VSFAAPDEFRWADPANWYDHSRVVIDALAEAIASYKGDAVGPSVAGRRENGPCHFGGRRDVA